MIQLLNKYFNDLNVPEVRSAIVSWVGTMLLGLVTPFVLIYGFEASWKWIGLGAISWTIALPLKITLMWLSSYIVLQKWILIRAVTSGFISAVTELAVGMLVFNATALTSAPVANIVAFGAGAGCFEIVFLLAVSVVEKTPDDVVARWSEGARQSVWVRNALLVERGVALATHIGTRGLICLAIWERIPLAAGVAVVTFAIIDGIAEFGELNQWNWYEPRIFYSFYIICTILSFFNLFLFYQLVP